MNKFILCCLLVTLKAALLMLALHRVHSQGTTPKLCNWDCGYYEDIAATGYGEQSQAGVKAFYPAFPLLVKSLWSVLPGEDFGWKATVLNLLLFGVLLFLLMTWVEGLGFQHSWMVAVLLTCDRFSIWAQVPYTETLFMTVVMTFLLLAQRLRDTFLNITLLALVGGAAGLVRFVGLSCVGSLGLGRIYYFLRKPYVGIWALLLGCWGVALFFYYMHIEFGSWYANLEAISHWGRSFSPLGFFTSIFYLIKMAYFPTILVVLGSAFLILNPPSWMKLTVQDRWLWTVLMLIPLCTTLPTSMTRYMSIVFLGHLAWAYAIKKTQKLPMPWLFEGAWIAVLCIELYFQVHLLEKFLRTEAFSWAG